MPLSCVDAEDIALPITDRDDLPCCVLNVREGRALCVAQAEILERCQRQRPEPPKLNSGTKLTELAHGFRSKEGEAHTAKYATKHFRQKGA